jgi:predicted nucleic acid-binding protein
VLVVDASVLVTALVDDSEDGALSRTRLRGEDLAAPEIVDLEVLSVLRRQVRVGDLSERRASLAARDLVDLPLARAPHRALVERCWELRDNLTICDASYVALAEALRTRMLTADARLAAAPGPRCPIEVLSHPDRYRATPRTSVHEGRPAMDVAMVHADAEGG